MDHINLNRPYFFAIIYWIVKSSNLFTDCNNNENDLPRWTDQECWKLAPHQHESFTVKINVKFRLSEFLSSVKVKLIFQECTENNHDIAESVKAM